MYSLVLLVCVNTLGTCMTIAPDQLFSTKQECEGAFFIALDIADDDLNVDVMDGQCVNWGRGS